MGVPADLWGGIGSETAESEAEAAIFNSFSLLSASTPYAGLRCRPAHNAIATVAPSRSGKVSHFYDRPHETPVRVTGHVCFTYCILGSNNYHNVLVAVVCPHRFEPSSRVSGSKFSYCGQ